MTNFLFQKIWLAVIVLLFAGTVGYGGYVWGTQEEEELTPEIISTEQARPEQGSSGDWEQYEEFGFSTEIPTPWQGCLVGADMLYWVYAVTNEELPCPQTNELSWSPPLEAVFIENSYVGNRTLGKYDSEGELIEEEMQEKQGIILSDLEGRFYQYADGRATLLVVDHSNFSRAEGGVTPSYQIFTYHYNNPEIRAIFDRIVETFEIKEK